MLLELNARLKPGGVLFSSNRRGHTEEGWNGGCYGVYHDLETWRGYVWAAGFVELAHYYRPAGLPREQQPWLASVWRRLALKSIASIGDFHRSARTHGRTSWQRLLTTAVRVSSIRRPAAGLPPR